jgi:hypothetical protein
MLSQNTAVQADESDRNKDNSSREPLFVENLSVRCPAAVYRYSAAWLEEDEVDILCIDQVCIKAYDQKGNEQAMLTGIASDLNDVLDVHRMKHILDYLRSESIVMPEEMMLLQAEICQHVLWDLDNYDRLDPDEPVLLVDSISLIGRPRADPLPCIFDEVRRAYPGYTGVLSYPAVDLTEYEERSKRTDELMEQANQDVQAYGYRKERNILTAEDGKRRANYMIRYGTSVAPFVNSKRKIRTA